MDNEENINENDKDNSTSDLPIEENPAEETPAEEAGEEGENSNPSDDGDPKTTYGKYNNWHNNLARKGAALNNKRNQIKQLGDKLNNFAKKNPESRFSNLANKAGDKLTGLGNKLGGISNLNNKLQKANNVANAAEHPGQAAKEAVANKAKEKVGEAAKKGADVVKKAVVKKAAVAIIAALGPMIGAIAGALAMLAMMFLVLFLAIILISVIFSTDNTNVSAAAVECGFTISTTSLSREEYISAINSYSSNHSISIDFVNNAGAIYDKATSKHLNPELVVIRAIAESGARNPSAPYNYWGMGCTNTGGGKDCHSYSSFMDGVDEYLENISQYSSLSQMMAKYSYLGDYWYNPGDAGTGGCYYASFIYNTIPSRVKTACAIGKKCSGSNCVPTTVEEREQYTKWQVEKNMASIRENVFGLKYQEGVTCNSEKNGTLNPLTEYNLKHEGLQVLSRTLSQSEISSLNSYIDAEISSAGRGTGAGVAAAGQALVHGLEQKGYYLQYYWGGGHGSGDGNSTFTGVNKNWGSKSFGSCSHGHGPYLGMDCSGFVSWSIRTACNKSFGAKSTSSLDLGKHISLEEAKPGDLMLDVGSHVRLVIKNKGNGSIITAEESGGNGGLIFTNYSSAGGYSIIDMKTYYKNHCK